MPRRRSRSSSEEDARRSDEESSSPSKSPSAKRQKKLRDKAANAANRGKSFCAAHDDAGSPERPPTGFGDTAPSAPALTTNLLVTGFAPGSGSGSNPLTRAIEVPDSADVVFLRQLFGPTSRFPAKLYEESQCMVALGLGEGSTIDRQKVVINVTGQSQPPGEQVVARLSGLLSLPPATCQGLLGTFTLPDKSGGPGRPSHGPAPRDMVDAMVNLRVPTTMMDFSKLNAGDRKQKMCAVPAAQKEFIMTDKNKSVLVEASGAEVTWVGSNVMLSGNSMQVAKAERMLSRATKHCAWGISQAKVAQLLSPTKASSIRIKLSPMSAGQVLKPFEVTLTTTKYKVTIGKEPTNDVVVKDPLMSRSHCIIELDREKGCVYAIDASTNGTYLNGKRLPKNMGGKVLVSHGDELLLKGPDQGDSEFGYIVNLQSVY